MAISWSKSSFNAVDSGGARPRSALFDRVHGIHLASALGYIQTDTAGFPDAALKIGHVRSSGHRIRLSESDQMTILMPRAGRIDVKLGPASHAARSGQMLALRPGDRLTTASPGPDGHFEALVLMLPMDRLAPLLETPAVQGPGRRDGLWLTGDPAHRLAASLAGIVTGLLRMPAGQVSDRAARRLAQVLHQQAAAACIAATDPASVPGTWRSDADLVRSALRLMSASADRAVALGDIAADLGIGPRRLQQAFQRAGETSPREALAAIRLRLARDRLTRPDDAASVTDIAYDSGFFHLGRFSALYRRTYGELPSQTLARARGA